MDVDEVENNPIEIPKAGGNEIEEDCVGESPMRTVSQTDQSVSIISLGQEFHTSEDAYNAYNLYAYEKGFGIRRRFSTKLRSGIISRHRYVCSKEGLCKSHLANLSNNADGNRKHTRSGCKAMLEVTLLETGCWKVLKFEDFHNHYLLSPNLPRMHRSHNAMRRSTASMSSAGRLGESGATPLQISRAISKVRNKHIGRECIGIIKHFQRLAEVDSSSFCAMDLHVDGTVGNVFWADGRSRQSYMQFGDVLVFDITYRTNKFRMPFVSFVGVNHHRQTILFGGALIEDETEETFTWLFQQFLRCMAYSHPLAIITDEDKSIMNAVKCVFPAARHRLCIWHIRKHMTENLQVERAKFPDFNVDFRELLKNKSIPEFEAQWITLKHKYNIVDGSWLEKMYSLRHYWVKAFLKDAFFAGMTTNGRCASIHAFFDGYVNFNTTLDEFVKQYDKAVAGRRNAEEQEDAYTINSIPTNHPFVVKAARCYTRQMFTIFLKEWQRAVNECTHETLTKDCRFFTYSITKNVLIESSSHKSTCHVVTFDACNPGYTKCTCARMETYGIPCRHMLYVLKKKNVLDLPREFIWARWTIDTRYKCSVVDDNMRDQRNVAFLEIKAQTKFARLMELAKDNKTALEAIISSLDPLIASLDEKVVIPPAADKISENIGAATSTTIVTEESIVIRNPLAIVRTKDRPKIVGRIKSGAEASQSKKRQA